MTEITDLIGNADMEKFEAIVAKAENQQNEFYQKVIGLHEDKRLRSLAGQKYGGLTYDELDGFTIVKGGYGSDKLFYTDKGFKADIPVCIERGNYCESGTYNSRYYVCKVKDNKLFVNKKELLKVFPNLTLEKILEGIENGIKTLPLYGATEEK